jgi:hypothetical protein
MIGRRVDIHLHFGSANMSSLNSIDPIKLPVAGTRRRNTLDASGCSREKAEVKEIIRPVKVVEIAQAIRHAHARLFRLGARRAPR